MRVAIASLLLSLCAGCVTDDSALLREGASRQVPVLIYDTSWNDPREAPSWRMGDPVPKDALHMGLVETGDRPVDTLWLHVAHCTAQGAPVLDTWLKFEGPFQPGQVYADARAVGWLPDYLRVGASMHLVILAVRIEDASGTQEFRDDVDKLLTHGVSNFCPKL